MMTLVMFCVSLDTYNTFIVIKKLHKVTYKYVYTILFLYLSIYLSFSRTSEIIKNSEIRKIAIDVRSV